jgi:hypothetical protein
MTKTEVLGWATALILVVTPVIVAAYRMAPTDMRGYESK